MLPTTDDSYKINLQKLVNMRPNTWELFLDIIYHPIFKYRYIDIGI
jgi:hypothetical protein